MTRIFLTALWLFPLAAQMPQNPSPMKDSTRAHRRIPEAQPPGQRYPLSLGTLFLAGPRRGAMPLVVHFHGAPWLAEASALRRSRHVGVLAVNLGAGSGVYRQARADPGRLAQLLSEAAGHLPPGTHFQPVIITSFSAGYGAVREILRNPANRARIDAVVLMDGLHATYIPESQPGPLDTASLQPFVDFARAAVAKRKRMLITHSEIFPGTYASTTETADALITALGLVRHPVLRWGPLGMQQVSRAGAGRFQILGFAGNSAPDHVDHLHALADWLRQSGL